MIGIFENKIGGSRMKFRNADEKNVIYCMLSETEAEKYDLPEINIVETDLMYKVKEGNYRASINEIDVVISLAIYQQAGGYIGKIVANGVELSVLKGKPLRRQDILRAIVKRLGLVSKNSSSEGVDVAG